MNNAYEARAGSNRLLTNLAQTQFMMPELVMRILFPLAEVGQMGGLVPTFDSIWDGSEEDDDRAPGGNFNEVEDGYGSRPYKLSTKGLKYKIPEEKLSEADTVGIDWGRRATQVLMEKTAIRLERQQAAIAGAASNYASGHTAALDADHKFNSATSGKVNPGIVFREGNAVVRQKIGRDPNVLVLGDDSFDALAENEFVLDRIKHTGRDSITLDMLANLYNYDLAVKVSLPSTFRGLALSAYVDPRVIQAWRSAGANDQLMGGFKMPYQVSGAINRFMSNFGFTYTYQGQPRMSNRYWDEDTDSYAYKLKFNRSVEPTGVDGAGKLIFGYLHTACVA